MSTKTRRSYTEAFKEEAVHLLRESGHRGPSPLPVTSGVAAGREPRPDTSVDAGGLGEAGAAATRQCRLEAGARFLTTCGGALREGVPMRYRAIQEHDRRHPIRLMGRALAVSPAGYYSWRGRPESRRRETVIHGVHY